MNEEYRIEKLSDTVNIPTEKLPVFLKDLEKWILGLKLVHELAPEGSVKESNMIWIDDDENHISIQIKTTKDA